jgi:hypothetical protein
VLVETHELKWRNRFDRNKLRTYTITRSGKWLLQNRQFNAAERALFRVPAENISKAHFLRMEFSKVKVEPALDDFGRMNTPKLWSSSTFRVQLVLDEASTYESKKTSKAFLYWRIFESPYPKAQTRKDVTRWEHR